MFFKNIFFVYTLSKKTFFVYTLSKKNISRGELARRPAGPAPPAGGRRQALHPDAKGGAGGGAGYRQPPSLLCSPPADKRQTDRQRLISEGIICTLSITGTDVR